MPTQVNPNINQTNSLYQSEFLKHLIRLPIFKKEIKASNYSQHKILNKAFIVNNEIINILKRKYDLKKVVNEELNNFLNNNVNYTNVDQNYQKMCTILHEKNIGYINQIKQLETTGAIQFTEKEKNLDWKYLYNNQPNFLFIDNIEIIDENFAKFLEQKFNNSIKMLQTYYVAMEEKILLIIYANQSFIYEIASFSQNGGDYLFEYLLEVKNGQNFANIELAKYIFNILTSNGIHRLILMGNQIPIGNNIFITFHPVKNNTRDNLNKQNPNNAANKNIYPNDNNNLQTQIMNQNLIANKIHQNNLFKKSLSQSVAPTSYYLIDSEFYKLLSIHLNSDNNIYKEKFLNTHTHVNIPNYTQYILKTFQLKNTQFYFPINFDIIGEVIIKKIIDILKNVDNATNQNLFEEICLKQVNGGFAFRSNKNNSRFDKNKNLIYLYSNKANGQPNSKQLVAILECHDIYDRNNIFNSIVNNTSNIDIIKYPHIVAQQNNTKCHLNIEQTTSNNQGTLINPIPQFNKESNEINAKTAMPLVNSKIKLENKPIDISDKLKVMILFDLSQRINRDTELYKVYLINPDWLNKYEAKEIKNLVDSKFDKIMREWTYTYDFTSLIKIIPILDSKKLKNLEPKVNTEHKYIPVNNPEIVKLIDKYIHFYRKKFLLVNGEIFALFQRYLNITPTNDDIYYIHTKDGRDMLIIKNSQIYYSQGQINTQNLILFGIIDKKENKYNIEYIFDYKDKNILETELQIIKTNNIQNYIYSRTVIRQQNNKDVFSPIFDNKNQIIGNFYLYKKEYNYTNCDPCYNYLNNELIKNLFCIYNNESSLKNRIKMNSNYNYNNITDEEFYIIKKEAYNDIQIENNHEQLKCFFKGKIKNIPQNQKEIYMAIKSLDKYEFKDLTCNLNKTNIETGKPKNYQIDLEPIPNPNNQNEIFYVFKDFELIEKSIANELLKGKYPYHKLNCSFVGNSTIVFHYPINELNKNYMYLISKIDENNNFNNEYLLIYKNQNYYIQHFQKIKYQLNNFLQGLGFMKGISPIVVNGVIEIGFVIQLTGQNQDLEYFPPIPLDITDITKDFRSKPLIGFENIGATCYMNATIQCLCNIKNLVEYFKYSNHLKKIVEEEDINKEKLCSAFKRLIENSYPYELSENFNNYKVRNPNKKIPIYHNLSKKSYAPENFKETISRMNPLFEGVAANDAKDLVNFLLMTLHDETNTAPPSPVDNNQGNMIMDQTNKEAMFTKFFQNFAQNYHSVISDLFYALNCNITQCGYCKKMSYNYQIYFFLIFPLEEVRKYKLMNNNPQLMNNNAQFMNNNVQFMNNNAQFMNNNAQFMNNSFNNFNNNMVNNTVDIYDCFAYDQKINFMGGENAMYCNYCRQTCGSSMCTLLTTGPQILVIILNRGKGIEFNVKINFYLEINLNNYIEKKDLAWQYELFGVITHIGESGMGGHFIAYCKEFWTNRWLKYNDAIVSPVNDFKREVIDFAMPYLLFYQKKG